MKGLPTKQITQIFLEGEGPTLNFVDLQLHEKRDSRCFLLNFQKFARAPLIKAVTIVMKGEMANQIVNYDTKTKVFVPI